MGTPENQSSLDVRNKCRARHDGVADARDKQVSGGLDRVAFRNDMNLYAALRGSAVDEAARRL